MFVFHSVSIVFCSSAKQNYIQTKAFNDRFKFNSLCLSDWKKLGSQIQSYKFVNVFVLFFSWNDCATKYYDSKQLVWLNCSMSHAFSIINKKLILLIYKKYKNVWYCVCSNLKSYRKYIIYSKNICMHYCFT